MTPDFLPHFSERAKALIPQAPERSKISAAFPFHTRSIEPSRHLTNNNLKRTHCRGTVVTPKLFESCMELIQLANPILGRDMANPVNNQDPTRLSTESLLRLIADTSPMFLAYVDSEQRFRFANKTYTEVFRRPITEILDRPVKEVFGPKLYEELRPHIETVLTGKRVSHESLVHFDDGARRLNALLVPHFGTDKTIKGFVALISDVTEQRKTEEAVQQGHSLLQSVIEGTSDAIFVKDLQGRYRMINAAGARVVGKPVKEIIGRDDTDIFPSETARKLKADDCKVLTGEEIEIVETSMPVGDKTVTFLTKKGVYRDHRGEIAGLFGIARDITERKRAEKALLESEARVQRCLTELEHVYATAPVGLCLLSADLRFLQINERLAALHGLAAADHIGRTLREIVPKIAELVEPICRSVIESGEPATNLEFQGITPTHPNITVLANLHPLKSDEGNTKALSVVIQDITERKRSEEALRDSEDRLASILGSAMDAIVTIDEQHNITLFNLAAEDVFRCTTDEAIGQPFERFASPGFRDLLVKCTKAFEQSGGGSRYVWAPDGLTAIRADGEAFPIEATISQAEMEQKLFTIILRDVNDRKQAEEELRKLQLEKAYLQEAVRAELGFEEIVGKSNVIQKVLHSVDSVAGTDSTVLIIGETGTGKELVARAIHHRSERKNNMLVNVNCAALPGGLIESELFGHEKGAFTGALSKKIGRFEMADGGTIFLDEIGDLPLELQAKLLRVLQEGEFERVGGAETLRADVRVVAATNQDLEKAVEEQRFRADLFYRLNVFPIRIPPLRERLEDISLLAKCFAMKYSTKMGKRIDSIPQKAIDALTAYSWPGNVRELQNVIERAIILCQGPDLELGEWPPRTMGASRSPRGSTLEEIERLHIMEILDQTKWQVSGDKGAARILGLKPTTLESRMKKLGIKRSN